MKIEVNNVTKRYAGHLALNNVSMEVPAHGIYGLLGPNGAGKTTLIRILNQITAPDSGQVLIDGEPLHPKHIERIGYLPEERGLYKKMKVGEQAIYLAQLKGIGKAEAEQRLKQWFDRFEITGWWNKTVEELSKGMQQKIQFITTIIHEPDILIFDEPFSGFDPINANLLKESILELRDKGATILLSTHNMNSVEELCDRIALINKGEKILEGSVAEIRRQHHTSTHEILVQTEQRAEIMNLMDDFNLQIATSENADTLKITFTGDSAKALLHRIMEVGNLVSYQEILPSMNDIFIQEVQSKNAQP
ncbi:MAG: ATP-binding cassette domain-containing protein [Bacteroidales bacterium]|nr:ATP-binding cassette domain-containing protein [Bacteroidales bacterium]